MSGKSLISWTDATWNPVSGCTEVSPGCAHCYAKTFAERFRGIKGHYYERGFDVQLRPNQLTKPLHWSRPRRIFVNSMSDLFHEDVADQYIAAVFGVMARARQHTFQILTKRIERAALWLWDASPADSIACLGIVAPEAFTKPFGAEEALSLHWPLPNVIIGPTVENQHFALTRLPVTQKIRRAGWRTMVSYEPALGPVDFEPFVDGIGWLICGGESGAKRRPFNHAWARSALGQAREAGIPFFMKQDGALRSEVYETLPEDLRVREFPA